MHDVCSVCNSHGVSMCLIEGKTIEVCKECGAVFVHELNIIVQMPMPLKYDNNIFAVSFGLAHLYAHLSTTELPIDF